MVEARVSIQIDSKQAEAELRALHQSINNLGTGQFSGLSSELAKLQSSLRGTTVGAGQVKSEIGGLKGLFGSLGDSAREAGKRLSGLGGEFTGIAVAGGALAATAAIGGLVALGAAAVRASAEFESYRASLTTVIGDSEAAAGAFDSLTQFAQKTPFSLDQSVQGFIKLKALGLTPSEAAMTSFGNTASAMGKDLNDMIEAVADASTGEFERLKAFGIKTKQQGDTVAFTFQNVTTKVKNNSTDIQKYLTDIGNTKFAGAMERQMKTFQGAMSNLEDTIHTTLASIGDSGLNQAMGSVINALTNGIAAAKPVLMGIGNAMAGIVEGASAIVGAVFDAWSAITTGGTGAQGIIEGLTVAFNLVGEAARVVGGVIAAAFSIVTSTVSQVSAYVRGAFGSMLGDLGGAFEAGGRSWANSIVGVLRTVKVVVGLMPQLFAIAINDIMRMFRDLGNAIAALLRGDFATAAALATKRQFSNTSRAAMAVGRIGNATYNDTRGADAAIGRLTGRTKTRGGSLDDYAGRTPKSPPAAPKDKDKGKDDAAKKLADIQKRYDDFYTSLTEQAKVAAMLPFEAERYNKELELRKILGDGDLAKARQLTDVEKARIKTVLDEKNLNENIRTIKQATLDATLEKTRLEDQARIIASSTGDQLSDNLAIEQKLAEFRKSMLRDGLSLDSEAYKTAVAQYEARERENLALARGNDLLQKRITDATAYAKGAVGQYGSSSDRKDAAKATFDKQIADLKFVVGKLTPAEFRAGVAKATAEFKNTMADIGDEFADKMNGVADVFAQIGDMIGGKAGETTRGIGGIISSIGNFGKTQGNISDKLTSALGNTKFVAGLGKAVGGAVAGAGIGEQVGGVMKSLGLKGGQTGAKIGGAIGGMTPLGPVGAAIGSVVGGLIGSLFYKAPKGQANITNGDASGIALSGNSAKLKQVASGMAAGVQSGLADVASKLGATVGAFNVSIGTYKDMIRVNATGGAVGGVKGSGAITYATEAEAVTAAIGFAIKQGALKGLSETAQKAVNALDIDSAINLVSTMNDIRKAVDEMTDSFGSSVKEINSTADSLSAQLKTIGASQSDFDLVEQYRKLKIEELTKDKLNALKDFQSALSGSGSGVPALTQLTAKLKEFETYKTDIAAGKSINQDSFTKLGQEILSGASDLYGTSTSAFQSIRSDLINATNGALSNAQKVIDNATALLNATVAGNDAVTERIDNTNELLAQQNEYLAVIAQNGGYGGGAYDGFKNGMLNQLY